MNSFVYKTMNAWKNKEVQLILKEIWLEPCNLQNFRIEYEKITIKRMQYVRFKVI